MFTSSLDAEPIQMLYSSGSSGSNPNNVRLRFESAQGTLFLYRSIIVRHYLNTQREVNQMIVSQDQNLASFALKRQKVYEAVISEIEEHKENLHQISQDIESPKKKEGCIQSIIFYIHSY